MIIKGGSVAECWLEALNVISINSGREISPLIVSIKEEEELPEYQYELEQDINDLLVQEGHPKIETTASTIFPVSLSGGNESVFDRFNKTWKYVAMDSKNKRGTYFRRLSAYGDKYGKPVNQLQKIIDTYNGIEGRREPVTRRSALIATTFDPHLDHTPQPQLGFPCLQQVCFLPNAKKGELSMNAIYAMQHLSTRAYGNYVGLINLGKFMAGQMGLNFLELNCIISVLELGFMKKGDASLFVEKYL